MKIAPTDALTDIYGFQTTKQVNSSYDGMAHFAGTGPAGRTCRECVFWARQGGVKTSFARLGGELLPRRCRKFRKLTMGRVVNTGVPHQAEACRHFEANQCAPPVTVVKRIAKIKARKRIK